MVWFRVRRPSTTLLSAALPVAVLLAVSPPLLVAAAAAAAASTVSAAADPPVVCSGSVSERHQLDTATVAQMQRGLSELHREQEALSVELVEQHQRLVAAVALIDQGGFQRLGAVGSTYVATAARLREVIAERSWLEAEAGPWSPLGQLVAWRDEFLAGADLSGVSSCRVGSTVWAAPVPARPGSRYGLRRDPFTGAQRFHHGLDFGAPTGTPVSTVADGVVVRAGDAGGYGLLVVVDHGGVQTFYAHLSHIEVVVGQSVGRGELVGLVGSTGRSTGPHLHFEVRLDGVSTDPLRWL
jgi:murein DD-endopeptidase MepM/ murein hydrolase activator NlpD